MGIKLERTWYILLIFVLYNICKQTRYSGTANSWHWTQLIPPTEMQRKFSTICLWVTLTREYMFIFSLRMLMHYYTTPRRSVKQAVEIKSLCFYRKNTYCMATLGHLNTSPAPTVTANDIWIEPWLEQYWKWQVTIVAPFSKCPRV